MFIGGKINKFSSGSLYLGLDLALWQRPELPCRNLALEGGSASASGRPWGYGGHLQAKSRGYVKIIKHKEDRIPD